MRRGGGNGQIVLAGPQDEVVATSLAAALIKIAVPWVLLLVTLVAGAVAHAYWGTDPILPWITAALTLAVVGMTWLAWVITTRARFGPIGRAHVAATVASVGLWLLLAMVLSPWARGVIDMFWLGGAALALSWNIRGAIHRPTKRNEDEDGQLTPRKAGARFMASLGMKGDNIVPDEVNEYRIGGKLALSSGEHTFEDAQKRSGQIATALGIPKAGVRIAENKDNAAEPEFSFTLRDVLGKPIAWPGPSRVGGTVFDTIPMGVYETGKVMRKTLADKSGAKHEIQQGMSGSGKSSGAKIEMCELMTRREVAIIVIDTVKGLQTFGPAAAGLALFITEAKKASKFIDRLMKVVTGRASWLGAHGLSEWEPGCGLTYLVIQIEEASNLFAAIGDEGVEELVKAARSAGVSIKISLQRPSHDQISTTTRAQLGTVSCYGMAADDPVCLLPDAVTDAGADPRKWGDQQPGCCHVAGTGISVGEAATPLRTYSIGMQAFADHANQWGPQMDPMDPVTAGLFGDVWTRRELPVDMVRRITAEALRELPAAGNGQVAAGGTDGGDGLDDDDIEDDNEAVDVRPEDMGIELDADETDDDGLNIDSDFDPGADDVELEFAPPAAEVPVEQARAAVAARLVEIERAGGDTVRVPDFADLVGMRSRAWFRKELQRLVKAGRLADSREVGVFRILPDPDALDDLDADDPAGDLDGGDDWAA